MTQSTTSADAYLRTRVMTASPAELRLLLLDGAIRFARQGEHGIEAGNLERAIDGIAQCRNIVGELLASVRDAGDPQLTENVRSIYAFLFRELLELGVGRDLDRLRRVIELLEYERETWLLLMRQLGQQGSGPTHAPAEPFGGGSGGAGLSLQA